MRIAKTVITRLLAIAITLFAIIFLSYNVLFFSKYSVGSGDYWGSLWLVTWQIATLKFNIPIWYFFRSFGVSFGLAAGSVILAGIVGLPFGIWCATTKRKWIANFGVFLSLIGQATPPLTTAILVLTILIVYFPALHVLDWTGPASFILPICSLALLSLGYIVKFMQAGMREALSQDYLLTVRSRGIPERIVIFRHAVRPAVLSVLTYMAPQLAIVISSTFLIEVTFSIRGLGTVLTQANGANDITERFYSNLFNSGVMPAPGMIGLYGPSLELPITILYVLGFMVLVLNLSVDLLYYWIDPRMRAGSRI